MRRLSRVLLAASAAALPAGDGGLAAPLRCGTDDLASGGTRTSLQQYGIVRAASASREAEFDPIRIEVRFGDMSGVSSADQAFLRETVVPAAVSWAQNSLSVRRPTANLLVERLCTSSWIVTPPVCAVEPPDFTSLRPNCRATCARH